MVLPQDPSAAPPPGMTPSAVPDSSHEDALGDIFGGGGGMPTEGDMGKSVCFLASVSFYNNLL